MTAEGEDTHECRHEADPGPPGQLALRESVLCGERAPRVELAGRRIFCSGTFARSLVSKAQVNEAERVGDSVQMPETRA
jgi:hypothetical protein